MRPFNFIGPRMDFIPGIDGSGVPRVLACFMDALIFNKPLYLVDGGRSKRSFTYIDDAVKAIMTIVENERVSNKQIFNIGSPNNEITIEQLAYRMIAIYKTLQPQKYTTFYSVTPIPSLDFYGEGYDDSDRRVPDISKAKTLLNWYPRTNLDTALKKTMAEYIKQYNQQNE
ncbi:MAG: NAD-dependent epimerase/dehydratase family protein [Fibrobacter sp.]|nr:NAD-dependent epimerase/dehydratase family protein [Fibrobacter sp.]